MSKPDTCAVIRKLKEPNKFGERYRIDFHRYRDGKIQECLRNYEIESIERAYAMLRGDTWVRDYYNIVRIEEIDEEDVIPGHEKPMYDKLTPTYEVYELEIEAFEGYINQWLKEEKGIDVHISVYGGNGGGYGAFGFTFKNKEHLKILKTLYDLEEEEEYELVEPLMYDVFRTNNIQYDYDIQRECLLVYKPLS